MVAEETHPEELWSIDPDHGMQFGPGYLGDAPHSLRVRELYRYYQPSKQPTQSPLNLSDIDPESTPATCSSPSLSASFNLKKSSHDTILACFTNLIARTLDAKRCVMTMTGSGYSYIVAESTQTLSLHYPHTYAPTDQLWLGAGMSASSIGELCEHTCALVHPPKSNKPLILEIPDLRRHPKYHNKGFVKNWPFGRFYASVPLRTRTGVSIGTVCVLDDRVRPHGFTESEREQMTSFAEIVMDYLEMKRDGEEGRQKQATEVALGRFIAEVFLEEEHGENSPGIGMVERRDGRVWNAAGLEQRRRKEAERRKRVEERRAEVQERSFAEMAKRESERKQKKKEWLEREQEDSLRMRKDKCKTQMPRQLKLQMSDTSSEVDRTVTTVTSPSAYNNFMRLVTEDDLERAGKASIPQQPQFSQECSDEKLLRQFDAKPNPLQPGLIEIQYEGKAKCELSEDEEMELDMPSHGPGIIDLGLMDTIVPPLMTSTTLASPMSEPVSYFSLSTDSTTPSTVAGALDTPNYDENGPGPQRRSMYEESASVEGAFRHSFLRAAAFIHNAINANVVFLNPDLEGFFDEGDASVEASLDGPVDITTAKEATYVSSSAELEAAARARRPEWLRRRTGVLAYSTSAGSSNTLSPFDSVVTGSTQLREMGFDAAALDENSLAQIVTENQAGGGIIAIGCSAYPGLEENIDMDNLTTTEKMLPKFLPGVRSAIVVPLVGGEHSTGTMPTAPGSAFAVAVVWTCEETRTFCEEVEGRFVGAVARGIVAEVNRLHVLNADKAKSEFISSISHELRTPLHGILVSADFLAESSNLDATQRSFVETIISCASTLLETVNHVLEFQKLNSGGQWLQNELEKTNSDISSDKSLDERNHDKTIRDEPIMAGEPQNLSSSPPLNSVRPTLTSPNVPVAFSRTDTDLAMIIQDITDHVCLEHNLKGVLTTTTSLTDTPSTIKSTDPTAARGISVILDIPPGDWMFSLNRPALRRIICNLVGNSLKYNRPGGWVKVSIKTDKTDKDPATRQKVTLTVADSGKGISKEFLKTKLFTPFWQENPLSPGAGLGLSLVRQLVGALGGRIDVTSQLGVGTTMVVEGSLARAMSPTDGPHMISGLDLTLKSRLQGKKVKLMGFDEQTPTTEDKERGGLKLVKESLMRYAVDYYDMEIVDGPGNKPDILIASDVDCPGVNQELLNGIIPVIVLCTRPPAPVDGDTGTSFATYLRCPFGPQKFTDVLRESLNIQQRQLQLEKNADSNPSRVLPSECPSCKSPGSNQIGPLKIGPGSAVSTNNQRQAPSALVPSPGLNLADLSPLCKNPQPHLPTILAVEDNPINMRLLTAFLAKKGYPFSTAADGLQALHRIKANKDNGGYDIILMDLQMPILSGIEATREIRLMENQDPTLKKAYIVALTGLAANNDRHDAFAAGVNSFMVKPAKFAELEKMWIEHLSKKN